MKKFFIKHLVSIVITVVVVASVGGAVWYVASNHAPTFAGTTATRGNVIASLDEPGTVMAENNAQLSFQEAGQIAQVDVREGDNVSAGTTLATLTTASLQATLAQAQAGVAAAQAQLAQLQSGTRPEQLAVDQTAVTNAQSALQSDAFNAYTAADDAIHNQIDNMFSTPRSNNPVFLIPDTDSQAVNNIQTSRLAIEGSLTNWYSAFASSTASSTALPNTAVTALDQIQTFLDTVAIAVNDATPSSNLTASMLAGYKVNVVTARTEVGGAITTLTNAQSALQTAQSNLALAQAGATPQAIQTQEAAVAQAEAQVSSTQVAINNSVLVAPFPGTVQNLTAQIGQVVSPGAPVLTLVNNGGLKIMTYVSEVDVAKIRPGQTARITLDAFGTGTTFPATVTTVDNSKTQVNGTPAYLVTLHFSNAPNGPKDGMTGNVHIVLAEDDNVIEVPSNLVINNGNQYFVLVQSPTGPVQKQVQIGLVGDGGMTEITSGLSEGDQLSNF